jgi:hypothetical protein
MKTYYSINRSVKKPILLIGFQNYNTQISNCSSLPSIPKGTTHTILLIKALTPLQGSGVSRANLLIYLFELAFMAQFIFINIKCNWLFTPAIMTVRKYYFVNFRASFKRCATLSQLMILKRLSTKSVLLFLYFR